MFQLGARNDVTAAIATLEETLYYAPEYHQAREQLMQQYSRIGDAQRALEAAEILLAVPWPNLEQALRSAVLAAGDAGNSNACYAYWQRYRAEIGPNPQL